MIIKGMYYLLLHIIVYNATADENRRSADYIQRITVS